MQIIMYTKESEQLVKDKAQCHEVIAEYITLKPYSSGGFIAICPYHAERTPSFHVDTKKNMYKCFGCEAGGDALKFLMTFPGTNMKYREALEKLASKYNVYLEEEDSGQKKEYIRPVWRNTTEIDPDIVKWFEGRKISQKTLQKLKITSGFTSMYSKRLGTWQNNTLAIEFNYFRDGELVNIKHRDAEKNMRAVKDAELIFYNLDSLKDAKECYITEGEIDVCALVEAGYWREGTGVVSVPNGANTSTNNLTYVDNCIDLFNDIEKIYIATDNDTAGRKLREDLAERFGKDRCYYIDWLDQKDANDVLIKYGIQGVIDCCSNPQEFPLEGAFTTSHLSNEIDDMYENGLDKGVSIKLDGFWLRFVPGYITVITGIPSHGKSNFMDDIGLRLVKHCDWKGAFYSPENKPTKLHFANMASRLVGKPWEGEGRITKDEMNRTKNWLDRKLWWIKLDKSLSLDAILEKVLLLKTRYGIKFFVIDAWNKLEHKGGNDPGYIGKCLDTVASFCEYHQVHAFIVAHPTKIEKEKNTKNMHKYMVPTMYNISGTADWFNKADNGICVYREFDHEGKTLHTSIYRQKVKFRHWGWVGRSDYQFDEKSGRYYPEGAIDHTNWITGDINMDRLAAEPHGVLPGEMIEQVVRAPLVIKQPKDIFEEDPF